MSAATIQSRSPQDQSEVVVEAPAADRDTVARAFATAREAAREWSRAALARADALSAAADGLQAAKDDVVDLMVREVGKPVTEATQEHARGVRILRYHAQAALDADGELFPAAPPADPRTLVMARRRPRGVAGLITPWNFPIAIPLWKAAPALAYGNTVVLKPASDAIGCALRLAEILAAALPEGVFNVVTGPGEAGRRRRGPRRRRLLHRLDHRRARRRAAGDRARHPEPVRDGRSERLDRPARRRCRGRRQGHRRRGDGLRRAEVHGDEPGHRGRGHRAGHRGARGGRRGPGDRRPGRGDDRRRPGDQPAGPRRDRRGGAQRAGRRRARGHRRPRARRAGAVRHAPPSWTGRRPTRRSPARRSSARS